MISYLKRIATGPEKSKPISLAEAQDAMRLILDKAVSDVQAGVFLVALRMKRETDDENRGILSALREATCFAQAPLPELVDIADPYDGFKRHSPVSLFLLPLLAACGLPAISHGCQSVGPKFGVTHRQIFEQMGIRVDLTSAEAAARLADPHVGWVYLDQSVFCPALHDLIELRRLIVKRPCIATLEKLCGPVRAEKNHLVIGYVHPGYEMQIPMAARHAGFHSCLTVKGVEGGVLLPMHRPMEGYIYTDGGDLRSLLFDPKEAGVETHIRSTPIPLECKAATEEEIGSLITASAIQIGEKALSGKPGPGRDALVFSASAILYAVGHYSSLSDAAKEVCEKLDSGAALHRFKAGVV
jgi:anthranilate phosphoribosyltransferase